MNILFTYLYRDAGNYKFWGKVVFSNRDGMDPATLEAEARRHLIDRYWFVVEDVGLSDLRPDDWDDELDHDWHEVHSFATTEIQPDDPRNRDIADFLQDLRTKVAATLP